MTRERTLVSLAIVAIVLVRSWWFVFTDLAFDSDQAVFGLMAKHLSEGRVFPLFMYGQNYMLAVEAWLAAPVMALFGASIATLKFPLLLVNLAVPLLLVRLFERELGLRPREAFVAALFYILPPPGTTGTMLEASGGCALPFLYLPLFWLVRGRPALFGFLAMFAFLNREFAVYSIAAIVLPEIVMGAWRSRDEWRRGLVALRVAAEVWLVVYFLRALSSQVGPGTFGPIHHVQANNLAETISRICFDPSALGRGVMALVTHHWPMLYGTAPLPATKLSLDSDAIQGMTGAGIVFGIGMALMLLRVAQHVRFDRDWWQRHAVALYFLLAGTMSATVYAVALCGTAGAMRYDLLSLYAGIGLTALFLAVESRAWVKRAGIALVCAWALLSAVGHGRILTEYATTSRASAKRLIVDHLDARGVKFAIADYWLAYHVTFLTSERIIVASADFLRVQEYRDQVSAHRAEAIRISRRPCGTQPPVIPGVWFCPLE